MKTIIREGLIDDIMEAEEGRHLVVSPTGSGKTVYIAKTITSSSLTGYVAVSSIAAALELETMVKQLGGECKLFISTEKDYKEIRSNIALLDEYDWVIFYHTRISYPFPKKDLLLIDEGNFQLDEIKIDHILPEFIDRVKSTPFRELDSNFLDMLTVLLFSDSRIHSIYQRFQTYKIISNLSTLKSKDHIKITPSLSSKIVVFDATGEIKFNKFRIWSGKDIGEVIQLDYSSFLNFHLGEIKQNTIEEGLVVIHKNRLYETGNQRENEVREYFSNNKNVEVLTYYSPSSKGLNQFTKYTNIYFLDNIRIHDSQLENQTSKRFDRLSAKIGFIDQIIGRSRIRLYHCGKNIDQEIHVYFGDYYELIYLGVMAKYFPHAKRDFMIQLLDSKTYCPFPLRRKSIEKLKILIPLIFDNFENPNIVKMKLSNFNKVLNNNKKGIERNIPILRYLKHFNITLMLKSRNKSDYFYIKEIKEYEYLD